MTSKPLARLRILAGYKTQAELAHELGVTHTLVSRWESGDRIPALMLAAEYATTIGISIDHLVSAIKATHKEN